MEAARIELASAERSELSLYERISYPLRALRCRNKVLPSNATRSGRWPSRVILLPGYAATATRSQEAGKVSGTSSSLAFMCLGLLNGPSHPCSQQNVSVSTSKPDRPHAVRPSHAAARLSRTSRQEWIRTTVEPANLSTPYQSEGIPAVVEDLDRKT